MSFAEECWFLRGIVLRPLLWVWIEEYVARGTGGSVSFDWESAWDDNMLVGWRHTHPGRDFDFPSSVDDRTMRGWAKARGKPMVCGVSCGSSTKYYVYGTSGDSYMTELKWSRIGGLVLTWGGKFA